MNEEKKPLFSVKSIVFIGVFAAVTAVLAQISIPTPWQIAFTLQTFAVALAGFCLGKFRGTLSIFIYILLGIVGVPVFTGFNAGFAAIAGPTGGYIWGFLFLGFACGMIDLVEKKWLAILFGIVGLCICYLCGTIQFAKITSRTFTEAFMLAVVPYIVKDVASIAVAYGLSIPIRKVMNLEGVSVKKSAN